ncbi:MAG: HNH endonuclease [Synechococcaceae bacterium WB9_4xC_028]|nr:HNH endonuclease [Synechococcaceae bacterium WB9_4xB_025]NDD68716.1 HNH endonuclease [Synechococcaceae bacterium WB9_4xC_028]
MHSRDAVFLEDLCPKLRVRRWRQSLHKFTGKSCIYCGKPSESIDHVLPRSRGGLSVTENCVPACLSCNGHKSDADAFDWYRRQRFYDPRRAMAIRAWMDGDLRLALRLLQWAQPELESNAGDDLEHSDAPGDDAQNGDWLLQPA